MSSIGIGKASNDTDRLLIIWKPVVFGNIKQDVFQTVAVLLLLNGCTTRDSKEMDGVKARWNNINT